MMNIDQSETAFPLRSKHWRRPRMIPTETDIGKQKQLKVKCLMHFETCTGKATYFTTHSWQTFLACTKKWYGFDCPQGEIARDFVASRQVSLDELATLPLAEDSGDGYHW